MLIGPPGAGKSAVGPLLADRLGVEFTDTDADVDAAAGKPVGDIFIEHGEDAFRELERAAVTAALGEQGALRARGGVLALGSGAVLDPAIRTCSTGRSGQTVVYLSAEFGTVARRIGLDRPRVVVPGNPRGRLRAMLDERDPIYARLAARHRAHRRPGPGRARRPDREPRSRGNDRHQDRRRRRRTAAGRTR